MRGSARLVLDLRDRAKDVRVVLLEPPNACKSRQGAGQLIPVQNAEVSESERQLAIRPLAVLEHDTVARAIHRLEAELGTLDVEQEHVLLVLRRVARRVP